MQSNTVAFDEGQELELKKELFLGDALSDLPSVRKRLKFFFVSHL